jgi:hypothetical protein
MINRPLLYVGLLLLAACHSSPQMTHAEKANESPSQALSCTEICDIHQVESTDACGKVYIDNPEQGKACVDVIENKHGQCRLDCQQANTAESLGATAFQ